jgi:hypothetical protein
MFTLLVANVTTVCSHPLFRLIPLAFGLSVTNVHFVGDADLFGDRIPDLIDAVSIVQPLEDAVASDHNEVEVVLNLERLDVGVAHDNVGIAAVLRSFGLDVSKRLADTESSRKNSKRSLNIHILIFSSSSSGLWSLLRTPI